MYVDRSPMIPDSKSKPRCWSETKQDKRRAEEHLTDCS